MSPNYGSGTGTPISEGVVGTTSAVIPLPYTYLSLPRYAKIMGINPAHFMRCYGASENPVVFPLNSCGSVWPRYNWQNDDQESHESLAYAIQSAEQDIVSIVGYTPVRDWVVEEKVAYPRPFPRAYFGMGDTIRGEYKSVETRRKLLVAGGMRSVTLVGTGTTLGGSLVYSDNDGDGLSELATITLATTFTDPKEIKVYFSGYSGNPDWEIRPVRSIKIAAGVAQITIDAWYLVKPELLAGYPTDAGFHAIDISTNANYVTSVDVYREVNDTTATNAVFYWHHGASTCTCGGAGCPACTNLSQDGCLRVVNGDNGVAMPVPASYSDTSLQWVQADSWTGVVEPEEVELYYYAGDIDQRFLQGFTAEPLSDFWAQIIAWVATARLKRPLCGCSNVADYAAHLSEDLALSDNGRSFFTTTKLIDNPLGTRRGEILAWKRLSKLVRKHTVSYALI